TIPANTYTVTANVKNTPVLGSAYTVSVQSATAGAAQIIEGPTASPSFTIVGGAVNAVSVTPSSTTVGASPVSYQIQLTTTSQIPTNGRLDVTFPSGFIVPPSPAVTWTWTASPAFTPTVVVVGQTVQI